MKPKPLESDFGSPVRRPPLVPCAATSVVGYIRGSTEEQKNTIEAQTASIGRYCTALGLVLRATFSDSGISGSSTFMERPAVLEMLAFMREHDIRQIVFTKLDRAFRSVRDCVLTLDEWASNGVAFHIIEQKIDTSNAMGRAFLQIMAVLAELENGQRSERQVAAFASMRKTGQRTGGVSYGWDAVTSTRTSRTGRQADDLVVNPHEMKWLRIILARSEAGDSDCAIARMLNTAGVRTKNAGKTLQRKGRTWVCDGKWVAASVRSVRLSARLPETVAEPSALDMLFAA